MNKTPKILIVEDEKPLREIIVERCEKEGFTVVEAKNGEEGLEKVEKEVPDLILLDIVMPRLDGLTMLEKLRASENGKHIKVLILTNLNDSEKVQKAIESHAYDYLVKSDWKIEDVIKKIKSKLNIE